MPFVARVNLTPALTPQASRWVVWAVWAVWVVFS